MSARYVWRFPEHLPLFLALLALEHGGCTTVANSGTVVVSAEHARAAYASYAEKDLAPRADDQDHLSGAVDPNLYKPTEPAFATINRIQPAQKAFFARVVERMHSQPKNRDHLSCAARFSKNRSSLARSAL